MAGAALQWWMRRFAPEAMVPVNACVHFCGFRYGGGAYHPYESYLRAVASGGKKAAAEAELIDFVRHYRPRNMGEALGVGLRRAYPLWLFPWSRRNPPPAWRRTVEECPDILTHFVEDGVARPRLEAEFAWLDRALASISEHGFQPEKFRSPILARQLVNEAGEAAWLLLDGNHRVAALAARGEQRVRVRYLPLATVRETAVLRWPQVRRGVYAPEDARAVFRAYFAGNRSPRTVKTPAPIVEAGA